MADGVVDLHCKPRPGIASRVMRYRWVRCAQDVLNRQRVPCGIKRQCPAGVGICAAVLRRTCGGLPKGSNRESKQKQKPHCRTTPQMRVVTEPPVKLLSLPGFVFVTASCRYTSCVPSAVGANVVPPLTSRKVGLLAPINGQISTRCSRCADARCNRGDRGGSARDRGRFFDSEGARRPVRGGREQAHLCRGGCLLKISLDRGDDSDARLRIGVGGGTLVHVGVGICDLARRLRGGTVPASSSRQRCG